MTGKSDNSLEPGWTSRGHLGLGSPIYSQPCFVSGYSQPQKIPMTSRSFIQFWRLEVSAPFPQSAPQGPRKGRGRKTTGAPSLVAVAQERAG